MRILIVCRGSLKEGLGHLLRTRTFARHAALHHEIGVVAIVEHDLESVLSDLPCPVWCVPTDADIPGLIHGFQPDTLVYDTTWLDPAVFEEISRCARLNVSISPVFDQAHRLDLLVTRSTRPPVIPGVTVLSGLPYAIFGEHCRVIDDATYERNLAAPELPIAVSMGGADAANKTLGVLAAIAAIPEPCTVIVLLGEGYAHSYNTLVDRVRGDSHHEIILAKTNRSMWRVMSQAAVAILAGGLTTVEAIHAGLPSINLFERPGHADVMRDLLDSGICLNGGLFSDAALQSTVRILRRLHTHREELRLLRRRLHGLTDAQGASRVLSAIEHHPSLHPHSTSFRSSLPTPARTPSLVLA